MLRPLIALGLAALALGVPSCADRRLGQVIPSKATVHLGKSLQLRIVTRDAGEVRWAVRGLGRGIISAGGEYQAPHFSPTLPEATIEAIVGASPGSVNKCVVTLVGSADVGDCLAPGQVFGGPDEPYVDSPAVPLVRVSPDYPELAREAGVDGTVIIRTLVCRTGLVAETQVIRSIAMLDHAAEDAVRHWVFRPASIGGEPVASWMDIPVTFTLH